MKKWVHKLRYEEYYRSLKHDLGNKTLKGHCCVRPCLNAGISGTGLRSSLRAVHSVTLAVCAQWLPLHGTSLALT